MSTTMLPPAGQDVPTVRVPPTRPAVLVTWDEITALRWPAGCINADGEHVRLEDIHERPLGRPPYRWAGER